MLDAVPRYKERINRYIMECKCKDVKCILCRSVELIDTLWNVNTFVIPSLILLIGINRYIMECKLTSVISSFSL